MSLMLYETLYIYILIYLKVLEAIEGMRVSLGPGNTMLYTLQGLFHPARRVYKISSFH
jgi:hypothetical protein